MLQQVMQGLEVVTLLPGHTCTPVKREVTDLHLNYLFEKQTKSTSWDGCTTTDPHTHHHYLIWAECALACPV